MKLGVFGGSFDPPHAGHLMVAQDALEALGLDLLLMVPARVSPFKATEGGTPGEIRAEMLEAALAGHPCLRVWRGELHRPAPSFTVDTLREIGDEYPGALLHLLMGEDQWASFPRWREPQRIVEMARVCVVGRGEGNVQPAAADSPTGEWPHLRVPSRTVEVSSTEVRERVAAGRSIRYLVPEAVRDLIIKQRLYGSAGPRHEAPVLTDS